jgi:flagellar motor switch protein FliN
MSNVDIVKKILTENWASVFSMLLGKEADISIQDVGDCNLQSASEGIKGLTALVRLSYGDAARQRLVIATSPKLVSIVANLMMGLTAFKDQISNEDRDAFQEAVNQMFAACQVPLKEQVHTEIKFSNPAFIAANDFAASFAGDGLQLWKCFFKIPGVATEKFFLVTPADFVSAAPPAPTAGAAKPREVPVGGAIPRTSENGGRNLDLLLDVELPITVRIGSTEMKLLDIMKLGIGSIIELEKLVDDPVDVLVNDRLVARGEVVVYDSNFAIRITEVESRETRIRTLGG